MKFGIKHEVILGFAAAAAILLTAAGCGGGGSTPVGGLSGLVLDSNNNPVPNVRVYTTGASSSSTYSSTAGSYLLPTAQGPYGIVYAQATIGGVDYSGQNMYQEYQGEQTKSCNIIMSQTSLQAKLTGTVYDHSGNRVGGAQVFALGANNSSSLTTVSDNNGNYTIWGLAPNVNYTLSANALGYDSDSTTATLSNSQTGSYDFYLTNPSGALLNPPTGIYATAFTSPASTSRSVDFEQAVQNFKRLFAPKVYNAKGSKMASSRTTPNGNLTEIDVTWTQATDPALYGWGVYRAVGANPPSSNSFVQFYYDPLASLYADLDPNLLVGQTYTYAVSSVNTLYGQTGGDESPMSDAASATVLGDMVLGSVNTASMTFNWQPASFATGYTVAIFNQYPTIGVDPLWTGDAVGTSLQYSGSGSLVSGQTYYYEVVGTDSNGDETFSPVGQFVAP